MQGRKKEKKMQKINSFSSSSSLVGIAKHRRKRLANMYMQNQGNRNDTKFFLVTPREEKILDKF